MAPIRSMSPYFFLLLALSFLVRANAWPASKKDKADAAIIEAVVDPTVQVKDIYSHPEVGGFVIPLGKGKSISLQGSAQMQYQHVADEVKIDEINAAEVQVVESKKSKKAKKAELKAAEAAKAEIKQDEVVAPVIKTREIKKSVVKQTEVKAELLGMDPVLQQKLLSDPKAYPLALSQIYTSHGILTPDFSPLINNYRLELFQPVDTIALVPEVDAFRPEYFGELNMPIVTMRWKGNNDALPEPASIAIRKQIDLPDDGRDLAVYIDVSNPHFPEKSTSYRVDVSQAGPPPPLLKFLDGVDDFGDSLLVEPPTSQDASIYNVFTAPRANRISLTPVCSTGSWLAVDGITHPNGAKISVNADRLHHTQVLEIVCSKSGSLFGDNMPRHRSYIALIRPDWALRDIPIPRLIVDDVGRECIFDPIKAGFLCPDPRTATGKARMVAFNEPSVKYTIENARKSVEVRLLNKLPSIPFTYQPGLYCVAEAGQFTQSWPITFEGSGYPSILQMFGWILAIALLVLLATLLLVVGFASICGLGVPAGATEIAATLTLIIQYFCFANFMRGSTALTEMITPLKWVTFFWPLPWQVGDTLHRRKLLEISSFSSSYGLELWGESSLGDVTDIRNACGCIFWCFVGFMVVALLHALVYCKFLFMEKDHTFPHRLKIGNWESRALHWLCFPITTAAAMVLTADITTVQWKVLAAVVYVVYLGWIGTALFMVNSAVSTQRVCWVWNSSVREDGELENESGYWADAVCDQLLTQSVNRGLCKEFFSWNWIATVADIEPIAINQSMFSRADGIASEQLNNKEVYGPHHYPRAHDQSTYTLAKYPKAVEVTSTRHPHGLCKGTRLVAGLFRTNWLDILFTYESLCRFHNRILEETGRHVTVPLTVKTQQLSGPVAAGANAFFFDGSRVPFVRIADTFFRILLGSFIGVALASEGYKMDSIMFACVGVMAIGCIAYVAYVMPYSRKLENWMIVGTQAVIGSSAFSFMYYAFRRRDPAIVADCFLWVIAVACFLLAAYSCVVTFSVFSAFMCPPLEESRFLEKLANCNVTIADHGRGFATEMPGYSKFGARDLKAQCTMTSGRRVHVSIFPSGDEAAFEFDVRDIKQACRTGELAPPALALYTPSAGSPLGYKHSNVLMSPNSSVRAQVETFLASESATAPISREVAEHIAHQVELRGRGRAILSVTVLPPRGNDYASIATSSKRGVAGSATAANPVASTGGSSHRHSSQHRHSSASSSSRRKSSSHHHRE